MTEFKADVSAAALLFLPFVAFFLFLSQVAPSTSEQLLASDPLVQLVAAHLGLWALPVLASLPALAWIALRPPSRTALSGALPGALAGLAVAALGLPLLRLIVGPALPAFVPPEESALPGIALGVGAGIVEEALFRFGILAGAYLLARRVGNGTWPVVFAVVVTALAFALSHELGPGADTFDPKLFATRFIVPGCLMSALFFLLGPSFLVTLHSASHVGIALLFTGPPSGS